MSRTTDSQWHLGESRPWPPPTPPPARRHRDTTAHPRPASLQSPGVTYTDSSRSKGINPQGKRSKGKVTGKPGKGHPSVKKRVRKRHPDTGKCIRSQKRSHKAQQKRDLRKRLHQVKQQISSRSGQIQLSLRIAASTPTKKPTKVRAVPANRRLSAPCIAHPRTNRPRAFEGKALVSKPLSSIPTNGVSPANVLSRYTLKGLSLCNFGYGRG